MRCRTRHSRMTGALDTPSKGALRSLPTRWGLAASGPTRNSDTPWSHRAAPTQRGTAEQLGWGPPRIAGSRPFAGGALGHQIANRSPPLNDGLEIGQGAHEFMVERISMLSRSRSSSPEGTTSATCSPWAMTATTSPRSARSTASCQAAAWRLAAKSSSAETPTGCSLMVRGYEVTRDSDTRS